MPFLDLGGVLADDKRIEENLLSEAITLARRNRIESIELRHIKPLSSVGSGIHDSSIIERKLSGVGGFLETRSHKVRMLLSLPESSEALMKSFKSKLRSQIRKPTKEGLNSKVGSLEMLEDFYKVFSINMRDLGSPVHSKRMIENVLQQFATESKIVVVRKGYQPIAASVVVCFKDTMENPWASALREYTRLSPNMLLYWAMLEYACNNGYSYFDFGRSSPDGGTYRFKEQWGAKPTPLHWHYISVNCKRINGKSSEKTKFQKLIQGWQKLPVPVTKIVGPMIRKHIGL